MFTDGTYFYKIAANAAGDAGTFNNLFIRYQSLADLCKDTNGEVRKSQDPLVYQYVNALPDGPVRFHYPGVSVEEDFGVGATR
jgi:hypothetical protein